MTCSVNRESNRISPVNQKVSYIITPRHSLEVVCQHFHVGIDVIRSENRDKEIVVPRQIVMYLCSKYSGKTIEEIGRYLGRDHSAVLYGISKLEEELKSDEYITRSVEIITKKLGLNTIQV